MATLKNVLILVFISVVYLTGFFVASSYNSDFRNLEVKEVTILGEEKICGLSYRLKDSSELMASPAVVLSHGISGSKQMMSGMALELARNGIVALTIDLIGHGSSGGSFGTELNDTTLGIKDAVQYLKQQSYVNSSQIALIGHSLGAGAVRATTLTCNDIKASVFIGGGLGGVVNDLEYGILNSTSPKNLLVVIGKYDALFNLEQTKEDLIPIFGNPSEISPHQIYGGFCNGTARNLIIPETTHLLEPVDPQATSEVVHWMRKSLIPENTAEKNNLIYMHREISILISLVALTTLALPFSSIILNLYPSSYKRHKNAGNPLKDWQILAIWGTMGLLLLLPLFFIGSLIPYPPLIFGNSLAWWLMITAVTGLLLILFILPKYSSTKIDLKSELSHSFVLPEIMMGVGIFLLLYFITHLTENILLLDLRIAVIPVFKAINTSKRALAFFAFIPFYLIYFFVEGLYLHRLRKPPTTPNSKIKDLIKTLLIKTTPYLVLIAINYIPMFLFHIQVFPSLIGFIIEFMLGIIPLFLISTTYSWWFYHKTYHLSLSTTLNAFLFAWISAAIFPVTL